MIRNDHGSAVAAHAARMSVMPLEREGGQAQFIIHDQPPVPAGTTMEPLLAWLEENAERELTLEDIATTPAASTPYAQPPLPRSDRHHTAPVAAPRGSTTPSTSWRRPRTRSNASRPRRGSAHRRRPGAVQTGGGNEPVRVPPGVPEPGPTPVPVPVPTSVPVPESLSAAAS